MSGSGREALSGGLRGAGTSGRGVRPEACGGGGGAEMPLSPSSGSGEPGPFGAEPSSSEVSPSEKVLGGGGGGCPCGAGCAGSSSSVPCGAVWSEAVLSSASGAEFDSRSSPSSCALSSSSLLGGSSVCGVASGSLVLWSRLPGL